MSDESKILPVALECWKASELATDRIYTKAGAIGTLAMVISAAAYSLLSPLRLQFVASRLDVFFYFTLLLILVITLLFLWLFLARALVPKSDYDALVPLSNFINKHTSENGETCDESSLVDEYSCRLIQAEKCNRKIDDLRMVNIKIAAKLTVWSAIMLLAIGVLDFAIKAQGVT